MRSSENFDLFWERVILLLQENYSVQEPSLPRKRKVPSHLDIGSILFMNNTPQSSPAGGSRCTTDVQRGTPSVMDVARQKLQKDMSNMKTFLTINRCRLNLIHQFNSAIRSHIPYIFGFSYL